MPTSTITTIGGSAAARRAPLLFLRHVMGTLDNSVVLAGHFGDSESSPARGGYS